MTTGKRQIARAAGVVMVAFVASRALGLGREMIISRYFGTGADYDAYLAAFRLPDLLFQLIAGGALGSAFIPMFTSYLARGDQEGAWRLASAIINLVMIVLIILAAVAALLAPQVVALIAPGFPPGQRALAAELMRLMLISTMLFGISGTVMDILNSHQNYLLPALAPSMYNLAIIGGAIFLSPRIGVHGLVIGVIIGAGLHLLIQVPGLLRVGMRYFPMLGLRHPGVHEVGRLMLPRMFGLAIVQMNFLVNTIMASGLPAGSLSALNYAFLLMLLPQGIFAQAIATVAFPIFSAQFARDEVVEMRSTLSATLRTILYLTIPASVGLYVLRTPVIQLLFQRGAFKAGSTAAVAWALQFYVLGLVAHSAVEIVVRAFYALHDTRTPVLIGGAAMGLNVLLSLALIRPLAHGGLALANSIATTLEMIGLLVILRGRLQGMEGRRIAASLVRIGAAAAAMGMAVWGFVRLAGDRGPLIQGIGGIILGGGVYFVLTIILRSEEVGMLRRALHR
ncbi:MAG TPA: murein biosynthesis integral membrane protein MurJ [Anaerolineae bacterium]|nr:murein biosynthesis integral membrane protein MurJ [Anaerolineae bacterium]